MGITPSLWDTLVEAGWTGLLVPDASGGAGAGLLEMCIVAEQMGRIPLPGPFFSSAVAATLAARALGAAELLGDLAPGTRRGTIALGEQGHGDPLGTVRTRARRKAAGWVLNGIKPSVVDGHTADWAIVVARSEEGVRSYLLESPQGELVPSLDPTRKIARLVLDDTPVVPLGPGGSHAALWHRVQDDMAVVLAAETVAPPIVPWPRRSPTPRSGSSSIVPLPPTRRCGTDWSRCSNSSRWPVPASSSPPGPRTPKRPSASGRRLWRPATPRRPASG